MKWSQIESSLPTSATSEREEQLLAHVKAGNIVHAWAALEVKGGGHTIELEVSEDALAVGEPGDAVRINVTATTAQRIANHLDVLLLTARIADLIRQKSTVQIEPSTQPPGPKMGTTAAMVRHSREVDAKKATTGQAGLTSNCGKDWVLSNRLVGQPSQSANYGWHVGQSKYPGTLAGMCVLQPLGLAHNRFHVDYSQVWRGVKKACKVDGVVRSTIEVLSDPMLSSLLSHEGPLKVFRQPGVASGGIEPPPPVKDAVASVPRVLRKGMVGPDVAAWQRALGLDDDGTFGPKTEEATKAFQASHGLSPDGVVGPITRAALGKGSYPFVQAKNFKAGRGGVPVTTLVLHSMEADEKPDTAERVAAWFAGPSAPVASAHYCVDSDSVVQCVKENDTAFHARGINPASIGIEHAGFAKQSPEDWADPYSETMLRRSAELAAGICRRHDIPVRFVDASGLVAGEAGITTHAEVSKAFHQTDHADPGPGFPLEHYLAMIGEYWV